MRTDLLQHEVIVESMSGETLEVDVSALKKTGIDKLLEAIQLQAELLDLKANPDRSAEGVMIEAKLERGRGPVGTVLVQRGTLRVGDIVVAGSAWGRVRALIDDQGEPVSDAGPVGARRDPGLRLRSRGRRSSLRSLRARRAPARSPTIASESAAQTLGSAGTARTLEQMMQQLKEAGRKEFPLVIKGDVQGSVEAIARCAEEARHR